MNDTLEIELRDKKTQFSPDEWIEGDVNWSFSAPQKRLEIRLLWFTQGKGTTDLGVVRTETVEAPHAQTGIGLSSGSQAFRFRLPEAPHSFSGQLISLVWAVEVEAFPSKIAVQREFVMAPNGAEIELSRVEVPQSPILSAFQKRKAAFQARKKGDSASPFEPNERGPWS